MTVVAGIFAFFGAGLGSVVAFWATRGATRAEREARRREEWGRRFTTALGAVTSADSVTRFAGRALLRELLESELASADDRKAAEAVLAVVATHNNRDQQVAVPPGGELDDVEIVQDNGNDPELGGAQE